MVSEGVDIPRLRVGVYATAAKTPLIFRQIVGRFVRTIAGRPIEASWLYLPADPILRAHAVRRRGRAPPGRCAASRTTASSTSRGSRVGPSRSATPDFVALSADVAPQLTLFGAPPTLAAAGRRQGRAGRALLRTPTLRRRRSSFVRDCAASATDSSRTYVVGTVARHAEINTWLNRTVGITRVEDATIDQLERTIELLLDNLTARR